VSVSIVRSEYQQWYVSVVYGAMCLYRTIASPIGLYISERGTGVRQQWYVSVVYGAMCLQDYTYILYAVLYLT
jgi:hypothetical protein